MNAHYKQKQRTSTFTGIGWTKQIINFVLSTHIDEWYHRCDSNSNPNQISFQNTFMSLEKRSLLITIDFFNSKAEILPVDQKIWFKSSIEEFKKYPVKRLKQLIANTKKLFKINKKNNNYDSNKITDYFLKIGETTEKQIARTQIFPLPNNDLPVSTVNTHIQKNKVAYSQKQYITNISSNSQLISENKCENINMSIPEYSSYSTVTSSSNSNYTIVNTKNGRNKNFNNCFQSDSASYTETSQFNNMRRNKTPKKPTIQYYTINDTTDSDSITSISENSNNYKNSDISYIPSTNDDTILYSLNKIKDDHRKKRNSNKYIHPKNNITTDTPSTTKIKNRKLNQKK